MGNEGYLVICSITLAGVGWLAKLAAFEKRDILLTYFVVSHLTKCEITFFFFCFPFGV